MKKLLCLSFIALGVLWGQKTLSVALDNLLEINVSGKGTIVIKRDGLEVFRIYSDGQGTQTICRGCSNVRRLPNGLGMNSPVVVNMETDCKYNQCLSWDDSLTTDFTWVAVKGDSSSATNLKPLEIK